MPRRRMIDPSFWDDHHIASLARDERLFVLGSVGNADDEGRLKAHPTYLKAAIFMYDDDLNSSDVQGIKSSCLEKMLTWPSTHPYRLLSYSNSSEEYLFFPSWYDIQKPSHATKSKLPPPPPDLLPIFSGDPQETHPNSSENSPSQVSLGQSSLGKVSIGQGSSVKYDFNKFLTEKDLTDYLTDLLEKLTPAGASYFMPAARELWKQSTGGEMPSDVFQVIFGALSNYPIPVVARSLAKAVKYSPGKRKPGKYLQTILDEQLEKNTKKS